MDVDWGTWFVENTAAILGIVGALGGAAIGATLSGRAARQTARDNTRASHNQFWFPRQLEYLTDVAEEATAQSTGLNAAIEDLERFIRTQSAARVAGKPFVTVYDPPPEITTRLNSANERWRRLLSKRLLFADPEVSESMKNFDLKRAAVVEAFKAGGALGTPREAYRTLSTHGFEELMVALNLARNSHTHTYESTLLSRRRAKALRKERQVVQTKLWDQWADCLRARGADPKPFED